MTAPEDPRSIGQLLEIGRALMSDMEEDSVLRRALEIAREATGARYAALGVLNERRTGLDRFVTLGIDEATKRAIGDLPAGRGALGVLIDEPRPLRLADIRQHPASYGFPAGHPPMRSFLGVPILIRGEVWGNLYLTEKAEGLAFTEADEEIAVLIADWSAIAVENARLFETNESRRMELEKAVRGLQATRDVAVAIGSDLSLPHALELIAKRGRALVNARSLVIALRDGGDLVVSAGAGHVSDTRGTRVPIAGSTSGQVLERRRSQRIADAATLRIAPQESFGVVNAQAALMVPMLYRGEPVGLLAAFDGGQERLRFSEDDEQLLEIFAASAANAVALAQSAQSDRLRSALAAADAERRRWGRELHDETLQGLGALRVLISSALRRGDPETLSTAAREAVDHIEREIRNLRSIITDLRPAALDELGLRAAIEALADHHREMSALQVETSLLLPDVDAGEERLAPELEVGVYRLVQEALTNVVKHADATRVQLTATLAGDQVLVEVSDNGVGFKPEGGGEGFGLVGMRERVRLAQGTLDISSTPGGGTSVRARLAAPSDEIDVGLGAERNGPPDVTPSSQADVARSGSGDVAGFKAMGSTARKRP